MKTKTLNPTIWTNALRKLLFDEWVMYHGLFKNILWLRSALFWLRFLDESQSKLLRFTLKEIIIIEFLQKE